jgi:dienelactone hydrolase
MDVEQLERYRHPEGDSGRLVLKAGEDSAARPVILLHELGGLSQPTVDFGAFLVEAGCAVHMPVLFGTAGQASALRGTAQLCWGRQLALVLGNRRSKIADWLVDLCAHVAGAHDKPVTVIGMCATGGLVFAVLAEDAVAAGVAAQPSLPLRPPWAGRNIRSLGTSAEDVMAASASGKPLIAMSYSGDLICPAGRMLQIDETFPESIITLPGSKHSTLVYDPHDRARSAVLTLLDEVYGPLS